MKVITTPFYLLMQRFIVCATASVLTKLVASLTVPFMILYLEPAQVGLYSLCVSCISVGTVLLPIGFRQLFIPRYVIIDHHKRPAFTVNFLSGTLLLAMALACLSALILLYNGFSLLLSIAVLSACLGFYATDILTQYLSLTDNIHLLFKMQLMCAIVIAVGSVCALVYSSTPVLYLILAQATGYAVAPIYFVWCYTKRAWHLLNRTTMASVVRTESCSALLFIPYIFRPIAFGLVARTFLAYHGLEMVGHYAAVELVAALFQFGIMQPLQQFYFPTMSSSVSTREARTETYKHHQKILIILIIFLGFASLVMWCGMRLTNCLSHIWCYKTLCTYALPAVIIQLCLLAVAWWGVYITVWVGGFFLSMALVCALAIQLGIALLLIHYMNALDAIMSASCSAAAFYCLIVYKYVKKLHTLLEKS